MARGLARPLAKLTSNVHARSAGMCERGQHPTAREQDRGRVQDPLQQPRQRMRRLRVWSRLRRERIWCWRLPAIELHRHDGLRRRRHELGLLRKGPRPVSRSGCGVQPASTLRDLLPLGRLTARMGLRGLKRRPRFRRPLVDRTAQRERRGRPRLLPKYSLSQSGRVVVLPGAYLLPRPCSHWCIQVLPVVLRWPEQGVP